MPEQIKRPNNNNNNNNKKKKKKNYDVLFIAYHREGLFELTSFEACKVLKRFSTSKTVLL